MSGWGENDGESYTGGKAIIREKGIIRVGWSIQGR